MRVHGSSALLAGALALLAGEAMANTVVCDGTGLAVEDQLWGVSGATLQSRVPLLSGGPNLVLNGWCANGALVWGAGLRNDTAGGATLLTSDSIFSTLHSRRLRPDGGRLRRQRLEWPPRHHQRPHELWRHLAVQEHQELVGRMGGTTGWMVGPCALWAHTVDSHDGLIVLVGSSTAAATRRTLSGAASASSMGGTPSPRTPG